VASIFTGVSEALTIELLAFDAMSFANTVNHRGRLAPPKSALLKRFLQAARLWHSCVVIAYL
jgi:hypothetical protein